MSRPTDAHVFLDRLRIEGGKLSNKSLREAIGWNEAKYWKVHQQQFEEGNIERGRGPGGTVILVDKNYPTAAADLAKINLDASTDSQKISPTNNIQAPKSIDAQFQGELTLYSPVYTQLEKHWARRRQLDQCHCEITAQQGRRDTGGSWTRPDLTVVGYKKYEYLPDKVLEVFTFEVKASSDVSIKGVLEALAHREAATRSYVIYHTAGRDLSEFPEAIRIEELAVRHGIGVIAAREIEDFTTWDEVATAPRASPDPDALETFIKRTLSEAAKTKLRTWL